MPPPNQRDFFELVREITAILQDLEISHHLTGGLISSYYGDPRFTQDIDLVVKLDAASAISISSRLARSFQIDLDSVLDAAENQGMFQAYDPERFIKIDFHVGEEIPGELSRTRRVELIAAETPATRLAELRDQINRPNPAHRSQPGSNETQPPARPPRRCRLRNR